LDAPVLAIGLGANLPSACGGPIQTLVAVRPQLDALLRAWSGVSCELVWSPLFRTAPVGGPPGQPDYVNAALVVQLAREPQTEASLELLDQLQRLELAFGRQRLEHWGPRTLDLDLLWWGDLRCDSTVLQLPHPRWQQRGFVLAPLAAIEQALEQPLPLPSGCVGLAEQLVLSTDAAPQPFRPSPIGWE
jgi:2-amino-4-hydroxy-6-hydroxymethyldihydropteridine diphosphokinase